MGCYEKLEKFVNKYPGTVTWFRLKKHCEIIDKHLNPNETIKFIMAGQLDGNHLSFLNTGVVAVTTERIMIAQNRLTVGYVFKSITPDMYNDLTVDAGLLWGMVTIDTIKEKVYISNISKKALPEIETAVTMCMQEAKKKYRKKENQD